MPAFSSRQVVAALVALAVTGCSAATAPTADGARHAYTVPNTLRVISSVVPRTLNPIFGTQTVEGALGRLTTDVLVTADERGNPVPTLAREVPTKANGGISRDGKTITYHLRRGVRWHDGAAFTSRDVAFTFGAIMNKNNDVNSRHGYDLVTRLDTPDPYTVVFHLNAPFAPFVQTVFGDSDSPYGVLPAHLLARYRSLNDVPYNSAPIGTGPFKIVRWVRGDHIDYVRNDDYFLGKPKIEKIVWRFVSDENTAETLVRTHETDWFFEATVNAYKYLKTLPNERIVLSPLNGYLGLMFNAGSGKTADVRLRRAIAMAIDKVRLTNELTGGAAHAAAGDLPQFLAVFDPTVRSIPYSVAGAKAALAGLGYGPAHPLNLDLVYERSSVTNRAVLVQLQAALHEVGVELHPRGELSSIIYAGYGAGGTLSRGKYDLAIYPWVAGVDPDNSSQFTCANRPPAGFNHSHYCSTAMDRAQAEALTHYEMPARKPGYAAIERIIANDVPVDPIWWPLNPQPISVDLKGFDPNPVVETWDVKNWSI